jgi:hypothetical protein
MERQLLCAAVASLVTSFVGVTSVHSEPSHRFDPSQGGSINEDTTPAPLVVAGKPRLEMMWIDLDPSQALPVVNSNKIFLNNCQPNGCIVKPGSPNSQSDTWSINQTRTLTKFKGTTAEWNAVVTCMRDVFGRFGAEITTTDPGTAPHFEIMIAGSPTDLGMSSGIGGISPFNCNGPFIPNSLVFDFSDVWGNDIEEMCSTAAQEIAHSFTLDHVTNPSDPLTYFGFNGRRQFVDAQVQCGSDCGPMSGLPLGQSPFGQTCTGPNVGNTGPQNHSCSCTGSQTQNSVATITALFGAGTPTPPTVTILSPKTGDNVVPGFPISTDVTDDQGVSKVELRVNGTLTATLTTQPYAFNAPSTLGDGTHTVEVTGYDLFGSTAKSSVQVIIGKPCGKPADCPKDTDTCIGGRCVPGPGAQGGLGTACTSGQQCASGMCASTTDGSFCVETCMLDAGQCPSGFGCLDANAGNGGGVCFPGYDDGTGGGCSSSSGGTLFGLGFAALLFARRKRS